MMMNTAVKVTRTTNSSSSLYLKYFGRNIKAPGAIRFQHPKAEPASADNMEKAQDEAKPKSDDHGDANMKESFGEGYASRSNDEGFGGVYGGDEDEGGEKVHGVTAEHKDYEKTQGSQSKDKERCRHQE